MFCPEKVPTEYRKNMILTLLPFLSNFLNSLRKKKPNLTDSMQHFLTRNENVNRNTLKIVNYPYNFFYLSFSLYFFQHITSSTNFTMLLIDFVLFDSRAKKRCPSNLIIHFCVFCEHKTSVLVAFIK